MKRLIALLERQNATMKVDTPRQVVRSALAQLMSDDLTHILGKMTHTLDEIELSLHDDLVLQRSLPVWRRQLGRWRNTLFHQGESLRELHQGLLPETAGLAPNMRESLDPGWDKLLRQLQGLSQTVDRASRRVETVFQALMSSMSIVESERAIAEAEVVSKLTHLAFFFIPLSLVAGIFGMNINVSCLRNVLTSKTIILRLAHVLTCTATAGIPRPTDLVALAGRLHRCQRRYLCSALPGRTRILDPADPGHRPQL